MDQESYAVGSPAGVLNRDSILFDRWPVGLRFEIGIEQLARAAKLYEFAFAKADVCILVSQDWTEGEEIVIQSTPLFSTPGILLSDPTQFQSVEITPFDETPYRLTWTRLSPLGFNAAHMFRAIANREQNGVPKVSSGVFVVDPQSKVIMHMLLSGEREVPSMVRSPSLTCRIATVTSALQASN